MLELCENTTRPLPRQRSHPRLDSYEVLHSDGAQAGGQTSRLNLHDAAGPATRRDDHDITTTRRTARLRRTPAGASTARSSHAPAPPYHPAVQTRRRVAGMTPGRPATGPPERQQIAWPNTGRPCASPSPSLRSTSASAWAAQARRLPVAAVCANVNTPPYAARLPLPLEALMDFPQCRNLGPCHQCKFTPKKLFAPHTHTAPWRRPRRNISKYYARSPQHAANSPRYAAMLRYRD